MELDDAYWRRPDVTAPSDGTASDRDGRPEEHTGEVATRSPTAPDRPRPRPLAAPAVAPAARTGLERRIEPARQFGTIEAPVRRVAPTPAVPTGMHTPTVAPLPPPAPAASSPPPTSYAGPPRMQAPPAGWQPQLMVLPSAPRRLPAQDHAQIDLEESRALAMTRGIAIAAGVIMLVLMCALCSRWVF